MLKKINITLSAGCFLMAAIQVPFTPNLLNMLSFGYCFMLGVALLILAFRSTGNVFPLSEHPQISKFNSSAIREEMAIFEATLSAEPKTNRC